MGKIQITVDTNDTDKRHMKFEAEQCTETDIANVLREAFFDSKKLRSSKTQHIAAST